MWIGINASRSIRIYQLQPRFWLIWEILHRQVSAFLEGAVMPRLVEMNIYWLSNKPHSFQVGGFCGKLRPYCMPKKPPEVYRKQATSPLFDFDSIPDVSSWWDGNQWGGTPRLKPRFRLNRWWSCGPNAWSLKRRNGRQSRTDRIRIWIVSDSSWKH